MKAQFAGVGDGYPPCLVNLLYELAKDNKISDKNNVNFKEIKILDDFIKLNPNFTEEKLDGTSEYKNDLEINTINDKKINKK